MKLLIRVLLSLGFTMAMAMLGSWGAQQGPVREFRIAWMLALLAFGFVQTALDAPSDRRLPAQLGPLLKFIALGTLLSWLACLSVIGFDNTGFGSFLNLMAGLGLACALLSLVAHRFSHTSA